MPTSRRARKGGLALALSGGGYRAALFHLGFLRRLNEIDLLRQVDAISSVSGGSIINAILAKTTARWKEGRLSGEDWNRIIRDPMVAFTKNDIRTYPVLKSLAQFWKRGVAVAETEKSYQKMLTRQTLGDLPEEVDFIFCASDIVFSHNWSFRRKKTGSYIAGYVRNWKSIPVAKAVAASSCFPPVFGPQVLGFSKPEMRKGSDSPDDWAELVPHIRLTDGGVYDNLGLEPVWKSTGTLICSDGGKPTNFKTSKRASTLARYSEILQDQVGKLRRKWFLDKIKNSSIDFHGCYLGINNHSNPLAYSTEFATEVIANIRTDLDPFTDLEAQVLENHGYAVADHRIREKLASADLNPDLVIDPEALANPALPFPDLGTEEDLRESLKKSGQRQLLRWTRRRKL